MMPVRVCVLAGRLVASLIVDFMRVFHLDFSLAVFQPEINMVRWRRITALIPPACRSATLT